MPADLPNLAGGNPLAAGFMSNTSDLPYRGRFAPSPTGSLHFGSLVSALASYVDAHHADGKWLVRIEDLDPPREQAGAADAILRCLERHGLQWDESVEYQSQRWSIYEEYLHRLQKLDVLYACSCTRQQLQTMSGVYNGHCRQHRANTQTPHALRLMLSDLPDSMSPVANGDELCFSDIFQGEQRQNLRTAAGDQILKRKDGLYAYQLAVVVDDIEQGITHIIRGSDLLDVTARQIFLFKLLKQPIPAFGHVTLVTQPNGQKFSKQNLAPELRVKDASANIWRALRFLGQCIPAELMGALPSEILAWAIPNWQRAAIHGLNAAYTDQSV